MERLTFRHDAPYSKFHQKAELCEPVNCANQNSRAALDALTDRLAAYEDTGLEPEDIETIKAVYVPDHQELKEYRAVDTVEEFRALKEAEQTRREGCPCDLCRFSPPSSRDGKPCAMCPAIGRDLRGESHDGE